MIRSFDSGVLLKLYLSEPRDKEADFLVRSSPGMVPFTPVHGLEMRSAIRQKLGRGEISEAESVQSLNALEADLRSGVYSTSTVRFPDVFLQAEILSAAHTPATLCRSLDTLHVALAAVIGATECCPFDTRQARMAAACGLRVVP